MAEAKINISLPNGTLEFEGSEAFVTAQVDRFAEVIRASLAASPGRRSPHSGAATAAGNSAAQQPAPAGLDEVFAANDSGVQILKDIPGTSNAEKTVNAAKLLLYGLQALKQKDTVLFEEVATVCKAHGCHDSANMAANLKEAKDIFIFGGSGKKQTLKLTVPGSKAATKLVEELKSGSGE